MIYNMRQVTYSTSDAEQATIIVNARLSDFMDGNQRCPNAKIICFDSFKKDDHTFTPDKIINFLKERESYCPNLELVDLSRACSSNADLESTEAKRFYRFVKALKENTNIDIIATPELEKLFPILLEDGEEDDLSKAYALELKEEKYSSLQAVTKLQLAQAEKKLSPELCRDILEHSNNGVVTKEVISAIDKQLSQGTEQLDQYIPVLRGCIAGRYVSPDNFEAIVDIAEKYIPEDHITMEDINFCFGLQKESSQSEEAYQRINNLIKRLIPLLPEKVRQDLDAKAALKEKKQQEYLQKRLKLQAKVDEYAGYLVLSDAVDKAILSEEDILKVGETIYENVEKYPWAYKNILNKIDYQQDEYNIRAAAHWLEPIVLMINTLGENEKNIELLEKLTEVASKNNDARHRCGRVFCDQLKKGNDSEFWFERIKKLLGDNPDDHILLMNTYEDMEQAFRLHPELIGESLAIFKDTLNVPNIAKGFNDHLHTLASIVGDTAQAYPEFTDTAIEILNDLSYIERKSPDLTAKSYIRSKIDESFDKIKQSDMTPSSKRNLTIIHEKDQTIFAGVVKELMNDPQTDKSLIEETIKMRLHSGLDVMIDNDSAESVNWNLAVLKSEALKNRGPEEISYCAEHVFNGVLKQLESNPNYDPSEAMLAIYDVAPYWLKKRRENNSDAEDLLILEHFDRIPKEVQKLYIGEYPDKMDNLITTGKLKDFPEIAAQKLKLEVYDYVTDINSESTYRDKRSLSGVEKWAAVLKEIDGYSSPRVCGIALKATMRIRGAICYPGIKGWDRRACEHFYKTGEDIKQFVKISTDLIDNVFEKVRCSNNSSLIHVLKEPELYGLEYDRPIDYMGTEAAEAFLSGDESYKDLWDKYMVDKKMNAYLMFKKPHEILQDMPCCDDKCFLLNDIRSNTYINAGKLEEFPELFDANEIQWYVRHCVDGADKDVVKAVKTHYNARYDATEPRYSIGLLSALMVVYDAEAQKGIDDKEIFSILYKARFSNKYGKEMQSYMKKICKDYDLTAPKLQSLCQTSYLVNKLLLKSGARGK